MVLIVERANAAVPLLAREKRRKVFYEKQKSEVFGNST